MKPHIVYKLLVSHYRKINYTLLAGIAKAALLLGSHFAPILMAGFRNVYLHIKKMGSL
jgi:hypothetical protein